MQISTSLIVMILVLEVAFASAYKKQERRGNVWAAAPTVYPTVPPFINKLTSMLFSPNKTSGETPVYGLLKTITSDIYPHIANATYDILQPLNSILNELSSNLYNGLCAPPMANYTAQLVGGGTLGTTGTNANPLTAALSSLSGTATGTSGTDQLSQLINSILGGGSSNGNSGTTDSLESILNGLGLSSLVPILSSGNVVNGTGGNVAKW